MLPHIVTTEHHWSPQAWAKIRRAGGSHADAAMIMAPPRLMHAMAPHLHRRGELATAPATHAYIDAGRWMAMCPFCPSAQVVHPGDRRFLCAGADGCANHEIGGAYVPIVFPRNRRAIEQLLVKRPNLATRNWLPPQAAAQLGMYSDSVEMLRAENRLHGIR